MAPIFTRLTRTPIKNTSTMLQGFRKKRNRPAGTSQEAGRRRRSGTSNATSVASINEGMPMIGPSTSTASVV